MTDLEGVGVVLFGCFQLVGLVHIQENGDVILFDFKEPEYFSIPVNLILDNSCEKLLDAQDDVLSFLVENLCHVDVLLLTTCSQILSCWKLLHLCCHPSKYLLINLGIQHVVFE